MHGLVNRKYKSIIKQSGHYTIQGPTDEGKILLQEDCSLFVPDCAQLDSSKSSEGIISPRSSLESEKQPSKCIGKGSHGLSVVRKMLSHSASWKMIEDKSTYQFPGVFQSKLMQCLYYTPDCTKLPQYAPGKQHFTWDDI